MTSWTRAIWLVANLKQGVIYFIKHACGNDIYWHQCNGGEILQHLKLIADVYSGSPILTSHIVLTYIKGKVYIFLTFMLINFSVYSDSNFVLENSLKIWILQKFSVLPWLPNQTKNSRNTRCLLVFIASLLYLGYVTLVETRTQT